MMHSFRSAAGVLAIGLGLVVAGPAAAQLFTEDQRPSACHKKYDDTGPGRDVIYVPTRLQTVERMLDFAELKSGETLVDLGSGDGRIVLTAVSKFGARGHGIEIDSRLVERIRQSAKRLGIADRARFLTQDLFESDFSKATVISVYLLPKVMQLLTPKLAALRPGTRIVSHDYAMLADWQPDSIARPASMSRASAPR
jgi:ubiquinone/menaquinone biosynthesis C-methylase UbiE